MYTCTNGGTAGLGSRALLALTTWGSWPNPSIMPPGALAGGGAVQDGLASGMGAPPGRRRGGRGTRRQCRDDECRTQTLNIALHRLGSPFIPPRTPPTLPRHTVPLAAAWPGRRLGVLLDTRRAQVVAALPRRKTPNNENRLCLPTQRKEIQQKDGSPGADRGRQTGPGPHPPWPLSFPSSSRTSSSRTSSSPSSV